MPPDICHTEGLLDWENMSSRPPERADLDELLNALLPFAQDQLRKRGEFFPFGAVIKADGEVELIAGYIGSEQPPSQELIDVMVEGLRNRADASEIRASGICYDARLRSEDGITDAIAVWLEHQAGNAATVHVPYSRDRFTGLSFGDLTASAGDRRIFMRPSD
jgi:hypothetical protein